MALMPVVMSGMALPYFDVRDFSDVHDGINGWDLRDGFDIVISTKSVITCTMMASMTDVDDGLVVYSNAHGVCVAEACGFQRETCINVN